MMTETGCVKTSLQSVLDLDQIFPVLFHSKGIFIKKEGSIVAGISKDQDLFFRDQHDNGSRSVPREGISFHGNPSQVKSVTIFQIFKCHRCRRQKCLFQSFRHLAAKSCQYISFSVFYGIHSQINFGIRMVHVDLTFRLSIIPGEFRCSHCMIDVAMGKQHCKWFFRKSFHKIPKVSCSHAGIDQQGAFRSIYQIHDLSCEAYYRCDSVVYFFCSVKIRHFILPPYQEAWITLFGDYLRFLW